MRIAVLSDIHGNLPALEKVFDDLRFTSPDLVVCAGDLVDYGPHPNEVVDFIRNVGIPCVMGNHDEAVGYERRVEELKIAPGRDLRVEQASFRWTVENVSETNKNYLRVLPFEFRPKEPFNDILIVHASPRSIYEYLRFNTQPAIYREIARNSSAKCIVFGHIHKTFIKSEAGVMFINVGSVGRPKDGSRKATYLILDVDEEVTASYRRIDYPVKATINDIKRSDLPDELADDLWTGKSK